jgi:allantoinase
MIQHDPYPRNLIGYGRRRPQVAWPGGARVAVSFVLNYEEGGERNVLDGDAHAENYLTPEIVGLPPVAARNAFVEDAFEYGSRAGFWRVLEVFAEHRLPFTAWAVGLALKRNPDAARAMAEARTKSPAIPGAGSTIRASAKSRSERIFAPPWPRSRS